MWQWFKQMIQSIMSGFARIFGPSDDDYPKSGVQPFEGEPYDGEKV